MVLHLYLLAELRLQRVSPLGRRGIWSLEILELLRAWGAHRLWA